jgi:uncharacterized phage protein (TIGR01671 family)
MYGAFVTRYGYDVIAIEQFTNIMDKIGRKIYEWDIVEIRGCLREVKFDGAEVDVKGSGHEEDWSRLFGCWSAGDLPLSVWVSEVKGNIHENPDLLEVKP